MVWKVLELPRIPGSGARCVHPRIGSLTGRDPCIDALRNMKRSTRRLLFLLASLPAAVIILGLLYMQGMTHLEGTPRSLWWSLEWAAETLTTTGYGADTHWNSPLMSAFVIVSQFLGLFLVFLIFPVYVLPFFEERFEARLPRVLPASGEYVLIYHYGPAVSFLIEELRRYGRPVVVLEEDEAAARRLHARGIPVVSASLTEDDIEVDRIRQAAAIVANGDDPDNATLILIARERGYDGDLYAMAQEPLHRPPMLKAGATAVYTPSHVLAAALAAKASDRISPRISGVQQFGNQLALAEMRIHTESPLAGQTLAAARLRERFGATVIGMWVDGQFSPEIRSETRLVPRAIIAAVGSPGALERLDKLVKPLARSGTIVVAGYGEVGAKVVELLHDAGEHTTVIDLQPCEGVDVAGSALNRPTLEAAGVGEARAVVIALSNDSEALFAAAVVRDYAPDVPLIARVNQSQNVERLYRVGTDFALSLGQVAGRILAYHILGEDFLSVEPRVTLQKVDASGLVGQHPLRAGVRQRSGCQIVAVGRGSDIVVEFPDEFTIADKDAIYLCGAPEALDAYAR